ncbi:uncharacterized protein LOC118205838 [Stegodyphus dumicola]|uniref:uncharacterized protein LOC118205838 n=1 Tax=Stegodyphus dumicola TaxID=202533 RepID=UPI0015B26254|nr:uncharacterized protein LOC118205838 [Stegodyphus dumicola]
MSKLYLTLLISLGVLEISSAYQGIGGTRFMCRDIIRTCFAEINEDFSLPELAHMLPTTEEFTRMCPLLRKVFYCIRKKTRECNKSSLEEIAIEDEYKRSIQFIMYNEAIVDYMCDDLLRAKIKTIESCDECMAEFAAGFEPFNILPTEEDIRYLCPIKLRQYKCIHNKKSSCSRSPPTEDLIKAEAAKQHGEESIVKELCDVRSTLHRNYIKTVPCANNYLKKFGENCIEEGRDEFRKFLQSGNTSDVNPQCLSLTYAVGCMAEGLQDACGKAARITFMEILQRTRIWEFDICPREDYIQSGKLMFFNYLNLSGKRRKIFKAAFQL